MRQAIKKQGEAVKAYQLGVDSPLEKQLITEGAIIKRLDGTYELFSQEAVNGSGQVAKTGDYFKVDKKKGKNFPYPIEKTWFEENHLLVSDDTYIQKTKPVEFYQIGDEMSPTIQYLIDSGALRIDKSDPNKTYSAKLWGTELSLPKDGAVIIYGKKEDGSVDFNLIQADEFDKRYISLKDAYTLAFQNLLFHEPLFQFVEENEQNMNVLVIGWNFESEIFVDQCFQAGQMKTHQVHVTVISQDADSSASEYKATRPAMEEFININGSLNDRKEESFGELNFITFQEMEKLTSEKEGEIEDCLIKILVDEEEKHDIQKDHYFLVSVGDDDTNQKVARSLNKIVTEWELAGPHTVHYVIRSKDENEKGEVTPICAVGVGGVEEIDPKLEQIAFNVHLGWKDVIYGDNPSEYRKFKDDTYNYRSSVAMALSIKYKLADVGIAMDDLDIAAEEFTNLLDRGEQTEEFLRLTMLEHRRWILFMAADGWQSPNPNKMNCFYKESINRQNFKDSDKKLHQCMVRSSTRPSPTIKDSVVVNKSFWDSLSLNEGLENLDELDRVSIFSHRKMYAKAKEYRNSDPLKHGVIFEIQALLDPIADDKNVKREWNRFLFCLENILDRNIGFSKKYDEYKTSFMNAVSEDRILNSDLLKEKLDVLDIEIWPVIQSNQYIDYKKYDEQNIWKIPFFLTYRKDLNLAMSFFPGIQRISVGDILFQYVASATVIRPAKIYYLIDLSQESRIDIFSARAKEIRNYFKNHNMGCEIHFIAVVPSDMTTEQESCWGECFDTLQKSEVIQSADIIHTEGEVSPLTQLIKQVAWASIDCYDCSVPICESAFDNAEFLNQVKKQLPCFEFDRRKKKFFNNESSQFLSYIDDHSFLSIAEMFSLSGVENNDFNYPGLANDYKFLWEVYKGVHRSYISEYKAGSNWKDLCSALKDIVNEEKNFFALKELDRKLETNWDKRRKNMKTQDKNKRKKDISALICELAGISATPEMLRKMPKNESQSLEEWMPSGISSSRKNRQYLIPETENGTISGFKFADKDIQKLLTKEGAMLEAYVYYSVCESGLFDDIASSYEFYWLRTEVNSELDLVLTKGFQSMIVECKDRIELDQNFYFKLESLIHLFGVNCRGVLVTTCKMNLQKNQNQINRGNMMGIVTINGLDEIERIGENLNALFEQNGYQQ